MVAHMKEIGPQRYRESYGRVYEEFNVGDIYEHRPGRTMLDADNTWFTLLTMNQHPLHFDHQYAAKSQFGKPIVNSLFTMSVVAGMTVSDISQKCIANLGFSDVKFSAPVFEGDTLYAESEVISKRTSKSRDHQGIVEVETRAFNQDKVKVMSFGRQVLVPFEGHAVDDAVGY